MVHATSILKIADGQLFSFPELRYPDVSAANDGREVGTVAASSRIWATDEPGTLTYTLSLSWSMVRPDLPTPGL